MSKDWEEKFRPEDLQRLRGFRLMDDDFMSKCFEENIECTELVLQIVLGRDDLKVEKVAIQHQLKNLQGRSIIFDIYATDHAGKRYNVEIQRADRGAGAKRARYHSSLIDANVTEPGEKLENLVETYVIFITERDVLGKGKPIYHIDRVIKETGENFGDEAHILYVNGEYRDESPIGILMHDFSCTDAKDMKYRALAERVRYFKCIVSVDCRLGQIRCYDRLADDLCLLFRLCSDDLHLKQRRGSLAVACHLLRQIFIDCPQCLACSI